MKKFTMTAALAASLLTLSACDGGAGSNNETAQTDESATLADAVKGTTFASAADAAGLQELLGGPGPYTILMPTDDAFAALPAGTMDRLMSVEGRVDLGNILTSHILPGEIGSEDIGNAIDAGGGSIELPTYGAAVLTATREGDAIILSDESGHRAAISSADQRTKNGVIHRIDGVLATN